IFDAAGIDTDVHYPYTLPSVAHLAGEIATPLPNARRWADEAFCIPAHAELTDEEIARLVAACARVAPLVVNRSAARAASDTARAAR
ncbi:MAG: DegT/DnrJ/EryC1/StrS family aminotransferase, partial [Polyangiales bacterium]